MFRRLTDAIHNAVCEACTSLQRHYEILLHTKTAKENDKGEDEKSSALNLAEKDDLINGLQLLYQASDRLEQIRLLTIAPATWGRHKIKAFFNSPQQQARTSIELRASAGVLAPAVDSRGKKPLDPSTVQAVLHFYNQDEISRVSSKKSDVILMGKQPIAKRYMLLTIGEAFQQFKDEYPQHAIERTQFFSLRPRHVKATALHDTCCCIHHENFELVLKVERNSLFISYEPYLLDVI